MNLRNETWNLQSFINSLVVELDRARDSLAVKALSQPLSYSVKDLSIDLQVFPEYDGDAVQFKTAKPGESGSSKISMQLVSTSDRAIRESSRPPMRMEDGKMDSLPIDDKQKKALEKIGVRSVKDLEKIEQQNINVEQVTDGQVDYAGLARMIDQARRGENPPDVTGLSLHETGGRRFLSVEGKNLALSKRFQPQAFLDKRKTVVIEAVPGRIVLELEGSKTHTLGLEPTARSAMVHIALDENTILKFKMNI